MNPIPTLRPMTIGDLLDAAINLYRKNFVVFVGIVAIVSVPVLFLQILSSLASIASNPLLTDPSAFNPSNPRELQSFASTALWVGGISGCLFVIVSLVTNALQTAALAVAISERYLGRAITIRQAYQRALRFWQSLIGASLIQLVVYIPVGLLSIVPCVGWVGGPILLVVLIVRWLFHAQAIVLENLRAADGLRRSWQLVMGTSWRVLGIGLTAWLMVFIAELIVSQTLQLGVTMIIPTMTPTYLMSIAVIQNIVTGILGPRLLCFGIQT